jgi:hypothetical protein
LVISYCNSITDTLTHVDSLSCEVKKACDPRDDTDDLIRLACSGDYLIRLACSGDDLIRLACSGDDLIRLTCSGDRLYKPVLPTRSGAALRAWHQAFVSQSDTLVVLSVHPSGRSQFLNH